MKKLISIFIAFCFGYSYAGTKGFDVLLLNIGEGDFYESKVYKTYSVYSADGVRDKCWEARELKSESYGLSHITKKKLPPNMSKVLAQKIWDGDTLSVKAARKILHAGDELVGGPGLPSGGEGYHGMYIIKPEGNQLTIMGVGANEDPKRGLSGISPKITITLDQSKPDRGAKIFEQALCKVSKPFNIGFRV